MFLDFYKLREQPFGVTPDPRYLYFTPAHREALASLFYGIETGRGFLALIAQPGMGKTTLLFQLFERLKGSIHSAFVFQTQCNSSELMQYLLEAFGLGGHGHDPVRMHAQLNEFLFREAVAGRRVALVIDEAQNLSDSVLETVRLLSNFEAPDRKLLQIVLAGQPELANRLSSPGSSQLRQRIAVLKGLKPLPAEEVARYMNHRLQIAGYDGPGLFTPAALTLIAECSHGIPRNINNICFNTLSLGCAMGCKKIGPEIVREAIADLSLASFVQQPQAVPSGTPTLPAMRQPSRTRFRTSWLRRRPFQAATLAVVLGSLLVYFGGHVKAGAPHSSAASAPVTLSNGGAPGSVIPPPQITLATLPDVPRDVPVQTSRSENSPEFFTYIVQPHDTLREICLWSAGSYNRSVIQEIQKLNQGLTDPNHIVVGTTLRLPVYSGIARTINRNGEELGTLNRSN
jgi:general secretion pathway protein A